MVGAKRGEVRSPERKDRARRPGKGRRTRSVGRQWDFDGDGVFDWDSATNETVDHACNSVGTYVAHVRVTDEDGNTATDSVSTVVTNFSPVADAGGPYTGIVNGTVAFVGSALDLDGSVVSYSWDFDGDGGANHTSAQSGTAWHTWPETGSYEVIFSVENDDETSHPILPL